MAQLRSKQIKLNAAGDILIGGENGSGAILAKGESFQVLTVKSDGTLGYLIQAADKVAFASAGFTATDAQAAILEAVAKAATDAATKVLAEKNRAEAAELKLTTDLANEVTRATNAEGKLTTDLASEVTRATNAEGVLATAISTEKTRAEGAEKVLTDALASEVTRATNAETALGGRVTTLENKVGGNIDALQDEVDAIEAAVGLAADGTKGNFSSVNYISNGTAGTPAGPAGPDGEPGTPEVPAVAADTIKGAIEKLDAALKSVDTAYKLADTNAASALETEVSKLETLVGNEKTRAEGIEAGLRTDLNKEISDRAKAISDEAKARADEDAAINARINDLVGLSALNFSGTVAGNADAAALALAAPDKGDVVRITGTGATNFAGTGLEVNVGDFVASLGGGVFVKFDNTDPTFTAGANIAVTGNAHSGYTVALDGVVPTANGGTGLAAVGADHAVLTAKADGTLEYAQVTALRGTDGTAAASVVGGKVQAATGTAVGDADLTYVTKGFFTAQSDAIAQVAHAQDFTVGTAPAANYSVTLAYTPAGAVSVFVNGLRLAAAQFTVTGKVVALVDSALGYAAEETDVISVSYNYKPAANV